MKFKKFTIFSSLFFGLLLTSVLSVFFYFHPVIKAPAFAGTAFVLGVNGHPLNQPAYLNTPIDTQMKLLHDLHLSYYRIDVSTSATGMIENEQRFYVLAAAAAANQVKLLPMLYTKGLDYATSADTAYNRGYCLALGFATRYGKYFDAYELGNEMDWEIIKDRSLYGEETTDFDPQKFTVLAAFFKGMHSGIKTADPTARTIIDAGTTHVGFFKLLLQAHVDFDIIGHHWYVTKGYMASRYTRLINKITSLYKQTKPVWITETNRWKGSYDDKEPEQEPMVIEFIIKCKANPNIEAVFLYELLDEPDLPVTPSLENFERNFGLVKWRQPYTSMELKKLAITLKNKNFGTSKRKSFPFFY